MVFLALLNNENVIAYISSGMQEYTDVGSSKGEL